MTAKPKEAEGLAKLREPFPPNLISKLPKPTKRQTEDVKADFKKGIRCKVCGSWHHPEVVHLDYVGHAALTDRLLDTDPHWTWEPVAFSPEGLPAFDATGGLWIKLTILGVTRLGYGHAATKQNMDPGAREKEVIGDALRNAGMRFGAALDLWHKGDLHADESGDTGEVINDAQYATLVTLGENVGADIQRFCAHFGIEKMTELRASDYDRAVAMMQKKQAKAEAPKPGFGDIGDDEIPY